MSHSTRLGFTLTSVAIVTLSIALGIVLAPFVNMSEVLAQTTPPRALFIQGGQMTVPANIGSFLYCLPETRGALFEPQQGTQQLYEFTQGGYEWALGATGRPAFPGKQLLVIDGTYPDTSRLSIRKLEPGRLYYVTTTVPLRLNCDAR